MRKIILIVALLPITVFSVRAQRVEGRIQFQQGQLVTATMDVQTRLSQQANGNAIDFTAGGQAIHTFRATNVTDDNITLHHEVKSIRFQFEGMGQKRNFDSDNAKDREGFFGAPVKDLLGKTYDMVISPTGKTLMVKPEKIELAKADDRVMIVMNMIRELTDVVYPPRKNESSFFRVFPDTSVQLNSVWTESQNTENGNVITAYKLTSITDSTYVVALSGKGNTQSQSDMMGMSIKTTMTTTFTGTIIVERATGMLREKQLTLDGNGTTEAMNTTTPLNVHSTITIKTTGNMP